MSSILASNFAFDITEKTIRAIFIQFGAIERVKIMIDRKTEQPTGAALIEMADDEAAARAIAATNGAELDGRALSVNAVRARLLRDSDDAASRLKRE